MSVIDNQVQELKERVMDFLENTGARSAWFHLDHIHVYLRVGRRYVGAMSMRTLEIANVTVDPSLRGQGLYSGMLAMLEDINPLDCLYVENVLESSQYGLYERRGFVLHDYGQFGAPSFYKPKDKSALPILSARNAISASI